MIPSKLEDSTYGALYQKLQQDEIVSAGKIADMTTKIPGTPVLNANGDIAAIKYNTDGYFLYLNSGGRFGTLAFQIVTEGSLTYRVYVSIDGVHWDYKCKTVMYDYVDEDFELGELKGGTPERPETDVFYYHVIGRLQFKIEVFDVKGDYYINALD